MHWLVLLKRRVDEPQSEADVEHGQAILVRLEPVQQRVRRPLHDAALPRHHHAVPVRVNADLVPRLADEAELGLQERRVVVGGCLGGRRLDAPVDDRRLVLIDRCRIVAIDLERIGLGPSRRIESVLQQLRAQALLDDRIVRGRVIEREGDVAGRVAEFVSCRASAAGERWIDALIFHTPPWLRRCFTNETLPDAIVLERNWTDATRTCGVVQARPARLVLVPRVGAVREQSASVRLKTGLARGEQLAGAFLPLRREARGVDRALRPLPLRSWLHRSSSARARNWRAGSARVAWAER